MTRAGILVAASEIQNPHHAVAIRLMSTTSPWSFPLGGHSSDNDQPHAIPASVRAVNRVLAGRRAMRISEAQADRLVGIQYRRLGMRFGAPIGARNRNLKTVPRRPLEIHTTDCGA